MFIFLPLSPSSDNTAIWLTHISTSPIPSLLLLLSPSSVASSSPCSVADLRGRGGGKGFSEAEDCIEEDHTEEAADTGQREVGTMSHHRLGADREM